MPERQERKKEREKEGGKNRKGRRNATREELLNRDVWKIVVERLKPNGVLLIWDFLPHGPPHRHHDHAERGGEEGGDDLYRSVMHHGFSEPRMREIFAAAGAGAGFSLELIGGGFVLGGHGQPKREEGQRVHASGDCGGDDGRGDKGDQEAFRRRVFFARGTKGAA